MNWNIPGTTLTAQREDVAAIRGQFHSLFLGGGIALSQVTSITGLDPYMVQNWVKRGFLAKPELKRYSLNQLCRIITISMLKPVMPMERICSLLSYVNGKLDDETDDIIDDCELYFLFLNLAARARDLDTAEEWERAITATLEDYIEPAPAPGTGCGRSCGSCSPAGPHPGWHWKQTKCSLRWKGRRYKP